MIQFRKKDKITIYTVEIHCRSTLSDGSPFEHSEVRIYYLDNKKKRVLEEYGTEFKGQTYSWPRRTSSRSIADLERKYYADYERFLEDVKILVTKIGEL
jgi:hypothetical protein